MALDPAAIATYLAKLRLYRASAAARADADVSADDIGPVVLRFADELLRAAAALCPYTRSPKTINSRTVCAALAVLVRDPARRGPITRALTFALSEFTSDRDLPPACFVDYRAVKKHLGLCAAAPRMGPGGAVAIAAAASALANGWLAAGRDFRAVGFTL